MRTARRIRYYCDYCRKSTGTRQSMKRHERGCTANPERVCGLCAYVGDVVQRPIGELIAKIDELCEREKHKGGFALQGSKADPLLSELKDFAGQCPACVLAALRQSPRTDFCPNFSFKQELEAWWKETNSALGENSYY